MRGVHVPKEVVEPRIRGFISLTAHPEGCAAMVREQIEVARRGAQGQPLTGELQNALVIGSSSGYGLASALVTCFGYGAKTLGVCFEKPPQGSRTGTAGWYNVAAAHEAALAEGRTFETINGDAFSAEVKQQVVAALKERYGPLDVLVYSLAAPRRTDAQGNTWQSTLKPIGAPYTGKSFDLRNDTIVEASLEPATAEEIEATVKVMGGEDWQEWVELLWSEGLLAPGFRTVAYSYIGPEVSSAIYRYGTIGKAKEDLERTAHTLHKLLQDDAGGGAWVSVNKGVVTQASSAIPAVPLYMSVLFRVMKEQGVHEGTIEQIVRLFDDHLGPGRKPATDEERRIRIDDREMAPAVQTVVSEVWEQLNADNLHELTDYEGYRHDFRRLFGFDVEGIDYSQPVEIDRPIE
jgi:enoyl-[acyl-carrier protein] reductase / trans-2-enoyl-CoA reductase (NAD+)